MYFIALHSMTLNCKLKHACNKHKISVFVVELSIGFLRAQLTICFVALLAFSSLICLSFNGKKNDERDLKRASIRPFFFLSPAFLSTFCPGFCRRLYFRSFSYSALSLSVFSLIIVYSFMLHTFSFSFKEFIEVEVSYDRPVYPNRNMIKKQKSIGGNLDGHQSSQTHNQT